MNEPQKNQLTVVAPRLPLPAGIDQGLWKVLTEAIFPSAKSSHSIVLALEYCRVRNLDILKRPVNIVPVWNSELGRNVETIWPSINEHEITATRTKEWAGMDEPKWGPNITQTFEGRRKDRKKGWVDESVELTFPEWCSVTVYRTVNGARCPFTEPVYWLEAYGRISGGKLPNEVWRKRTRGQLQKVAKAAALRAAFPEEGAGPTAEEMEGQIIHEPPPASPEPADKWRPPQGRDEPSQADKLVQQAADRAGAGEDAPIGDPRPEPPEDAALADDEEPSEHIDEETGEVFMAAHEVERSDTEPWADWCARVLQFIRAESTLAGIEKWTAKNKTLFDQLAKDAPKIHARFTAAIGKHRIEGTKGDAGGTRA